MKAVEYKKPVNTIPEGVWESSRPKEKNDQDQQCTQTTDLQGNGYPVSKQADAKKTSDKPELP